MSSASEVTDVPPSATVAGVGSANSQAIREKAAGTIQVFHLYCTCHVPYDIADSLAENISGAQNTSRTSRTWS